MANMSYNGQPNRFLIKTFSGCRTTNPATEVTASVFIYHPLPSGRTGRKKLAHAQGKTLDILPIRLQPSLRLLFSPADHHLAVGLALRREKSPGDEQEVLSRSW
jgi:hypothetical protein